MQVTVGSKYQVVIPKEIRKRLTDIKPGAKVVFSLGKDQVLNLKPIKKDWVEENYGCLKDIWKGHDPIAEVEKMRDEWEDRLKELGR